jgi:hypothetical protein
MDNAFLTGVHGHETKKDRQSEKLKEKRFSKKIVIQTFNRNRRTGFCSSKKEKRHVV